MKVINFGPYMNPFYFPIEVIYTSQINLGAIPEI